MAVIAGSTNGFYANNFIHISNSEIAELVPYFTHFDRTHHLSELF